MSTLSKQKKYHFLKQHILLTILIVSSHTFAMPANFHPLQLSQQAILVITPSWHATQGKLQYFERSSIKQVWQAKSPLMSVVVGTHGLGWDSRFKKWQKSSEPFKHEGDLRSPAGIFPIISLFGVQTFPGHKNNFPYVHINQYTVCVDDSYSNYYNKIVNTTKISHHDWQSAEEMYHYKRSYQWGTVIGYNSHLTQPGLGSCIFLHIWIDKFHGTLGCTALSKYNMIKILYWLDRNKNPVLIQLPESTYYRVEKTWNLPKFQNKFQKN